MGEAGGSQAKATRAWPERLSGWLALGANLAVLAGLVLVFVQLNQNERMLRAQTRHELSMGIVQLLQESAANEHLADVLVRGNAGEPLNPADGYAYDTRLNALLRYWEDVHYQYRMGLYDEDEFARQRLAWRTSFTGRARAVAYWCRVRDLYSAEFAKELDGMIGPQACGAPRQ